MGKLVRDRIPEIIEGQGKVANVCELTGIERHHELMKKVIEEAEELITAGTKEQIIEEMADLYEVLYYLRKFSNINAKDVIDKQLQKHQERGGFEKGYYLISVEGEKV